MEETHEVAIFLVDEHEMFRQGLVCALTKQPEMKIVGQAGAATDALVQLKASNANMVILNVDLGDRRGLDFVLAARKLGFAGHILVVTAGLSEQEALQLVQAGVGGILHKHQSIDSLKNAMQKVSEGGAYLEDRYLPGLFRSLDKSKGSAQPKLSEREREILRLIFRGHTNKEIGARIGTSEGAVKSSLRQLFDKLGVRTRAQVVKVTLEEYQDQL